MPSKVREDSPDRRREVLKNDSSNPERSEKKERKRVSHRKSTRDRPSSRTSTSPSNPKRRSSMPTTAEEATQSINHRNSDVKPTTPYPSFSKAHSKEAVGSREAFPQTSNIFTPPATDVNASKDKLATPKAIPVRNAPPSPPLTDHNAGRRMGQAGKPAEVETILEEEKTESQANMSKSRLTSDPSRSNGHLRTSSEVGPTPKLHKFQSRDRPSSPLKSSSPAVQVPQRSVSQPMRTSSPTLTSSATDVATNISSEATSVAPQQLKTQRPGSTMPPAALPIDIVSNVTSIPGAFPRDLTPVEMVVEAATIPAPGLPPPPPPPPQVPLKIPKVDYLLQHGGLNQSVPRNLLHAGRPVATHQSATSSGQTSAVITNLFEPYNQLLEDFGKVISKNGSLAVATGYRSVARRLLDRLEAVFARDISCESCQCCMCDSQYPASLDAGGVGWGEVLELVSGRRDLPNWPPFQFVASPSGLGISLDTHVPMQKLDIDVPEEFREHYIRQSRKTKQSVDRWLNRQTDSPSSPPEEVDDDTLAFAILTHLSQELRSTLTSLLGIVQGPIEPPRRAPSPDRDANLRPPPTPQPQPRVRPEPIIIAGLAIQRLYRLVKPPRDAETALFMLNNPTIHNALATLAAISDDEWDILISGRFDGFLRSGADDFPDQVPAAGRYTPMKSYSRGNTPAFSNGNSRGYGGYLSRSATPASTSGQYGAPIALDEETEIAALAEIERDIYTGMESLEDAFEALHLKAESIRLVLRERSAGLAAALQRRRGSQYGVEVRGGTPASGISGFTGGGGWNGLDRWGDSETDDGLGDWDGVSELAPDDSASNISSSRRRRPKRRNERRTPQIVMEEDESEEFGESDGTASPKKRY